MQRGTDQQEFSDADFAIVDNADQSKKLKWDVSGIPTGTSVTTGYREVLRAARTYYVRTDGSDSNTGLVDSAGGAFLTLQKAWNVIVTLDLAGFTVTIQLGDGTYTAGISSAVSPVGGTVTINGNSGTPANVLVSTTSASCIFLQAPCKVTLTNFEMRTTTSQSSVRVSGFADVTVGAGMIFGACAEAHLRAEFGGIIRSTSAYTVNGSATYHWFNNGGWFAIAGNTITVSSTPAFSGAWATCQGAAYMSIFSVTFSGSATGTRYSATLNGVINTFGAGATALPGNGAGSTATGGQYA